jgi:hypothetical protein
MNSRRLEFRKNASVSVVSSLSLALVLIALSACSSGGTPELPDSRPIVVRSGARLFPERDRLEEINSWFVAQRENIDVDPTFLIDVANRDTPAYPWESLFIEGDTARIGLEASKSSEAQFPYMIYAHYYLMKEMGRLGEFLPGAEGLEGYPLERMILSRVADAWLLGRASYGAVAYDPLEEILYSNEAGYLDAFILTARGEEFNRERQAWLREDPEALERYRGWFVETFGREPPGLRGED